MWLQVFHVDGKPELDVLRVGGNVTYSSILIKVFVMLEYVVNVGARWLLKTDDDAYVNIPQTVQAMSPDTACRASIPLLAIQPAVHLLCTVPCAG
jgi:hypothetical protein